MSNLTRHFRNTLLAGIFAAAPLAGVVFLGVWIEQNTRIISEQVLGAYYPGVGVLLALGAVYVLGLLVRSILGQFALRLVDRLLLTVPVLKDVYTAWKKISLTPDEDSVFSKVVLVPGSAPGQTLVGFTCGRGIDHDPHTACVFLPGAPNPLAGRLVFMPMAQCVPLSIGSEEAFQLLLSGGNYVPAAVAEALGAPPAPQAQNGSSSPSR